MFILKCVGGGLRSLFSHFGRYQDEALTQAIGITRNGRERVVLISAEEYKKLKRRARQAMRIEDLSPQDLAAIEQSEMPEGYETLDNEMQ